MSCELDAFDLLRVNTALLYEFLSSTQTLSSGFP